MPRRHRSQTTSTNQAVQFGPLAGAPKDFIPTVDRIDELARRILQGDILLPKFQREFVWEKRKILDLWDSIARGYPIGSILLWQSNSDLQSERRIAGLNIDLPRGGYPVNYLLDGQQRLSTICGAMFWSGDDPESQWNLAYDLRERKFFHLKTLAHPELHQIRLNKLADPSAFFQHVASLDFLEDGTELKSRATEFFNRFKDYKIASVTLGDMSINDVAPIFERINSQGTRLTIVDLTRAATWRPEFDLIDTINNITEELAEKGFGNVENRAVLRNLSAAAGGTWSSGSVEVLRNSSVEELNAAANVTRFGYHAAVDYLSTELGVPGDEALPYSNQLVVIAEFFRRCRRPSPTQLRSLGRWFWQTSTSGYFRGWNTGAMARDLEAVTALAEGRAATFDGPGFRTPSARMWQESVFKTNTAQSKLFGLLLSQAGPVDLLTGQRIEIGHALAYTNRKEWHHFFPVDFLRGKGFPDNRINCIANIVLLTADSNKRISSKAPSEYLNWVRDAAGEDTGEWLAKNLISPAAYQAAMADDFPNFLNERCKTIQDLLRQRVT